MTLGSFLRHNHDHTYLSSPVVLPRPDYRQSFLINQRPRLPPSVFDPTDGLFKVTDSSITLTTTLTSLTLPSSSEYRPRRIEVRPRRHASFQITGDRSSSSVQSVYLSVHLMSYHSYHPLHRTSVSKSLKAVNP